MNNNIFQYIVARTKQNADIIEIPLKGRSEEKIYLNKKTHRVFIYRTDKDFCTIVDEKDFYRLKMNKYSISLKDKGYILFHDTTLQRKVMNCTDKNVQVDHIFQVVWLNIAYGLRIATVVQNNEYKDTLGKFSSKRKDYVVQDKDNGQFYYILRDVSTQWNAQAIVNAPVHAIGYYDLKSNNGFSTRLDAFKAMFDYENCLYGEFRYNPLLDLRGMDKAIIDCFFFGDYDINELIRRHKEQLLNDFTPTEKFTSIELYEAYINSFRGSALMNKLRLDANKIF